MARVRKVELTSEEIKAQITSIEEQITFGRPNDNTPNIDFKSIMHRPILPSISQSLNLFAIDTTAVASAELFSRIFIVILS